MNTIGLLVQARGIPTTGLLAQWRRGTVITKRCCNIGNRGHDGNTLDNGVPSIRNGPMASEFPKFPDFAELAISISRGWIES